jgi:hypothetical protein
MLHNHGKNDSTYHIIQTTKPFNTILQSQKQLHPHIRMSNQATQPTYSPHRNNDFNRPTITRLQARDKSMQNAQNDEINNKKTNECNSIAQRASSVDKRLSKLV